MNLGNEKVSIRKIENADVALLVEYRLKYLAELQGGNASGDEEKTRGGLDVYFRKAIAQKQFFAFVAEENNEVLSFGGMIIKEIPGDFVCPVYFEGDILNMYTVPFARRRGISQLILNALLVETVKLGISKVSLHSSKDGEHLYRKNGFSEPVYPYLELIIKPENFKH